MFLFNYHVHNSHFCETKDALPYSQFISRLSISKHRQSANTSKTHNPDKVLEHKIALKPSTTPISVTELPQNTGDPLQILTDVLFFFQLYLTLEFHGDRLGQLSQVF